MDIGPPYTILCILYLLMLEKVIHKNNLPVLQRCYAGDTALMGINWWNTMILRVLMLNALDYSYFPDAKNISNVYWEGEKNSKDQDTFNSKYLFMRFM